MLYTPVYEKLLTSDVSPTAKLLYISIEALFNHNHKKKGVCKLWNKWLSNTLHISVDEIHNAFRELADANLVTSHPIKNSVMVNWMYTLDTPPF